MIDFLQAITPTLGKPSTIVVISAQREGTIVTITCGANLPLIYDYFGFPGESYSIRYAAPGNPRLAEKFTYCCKMLALKQNWMEIATLTMASSFHSK